MTDPQQDDKEATMIGAMIDKFVAHGITPTIVLVAIVMGVYNATPWMAQHAEEFLKNLMETQDALQETSKKQAETQEKLQLAQEKMQSTQEELHKTVGAIAESIGRQADNGETLSKSNSAMQELLKAVTATQGAHTQKLDEIDKNTRPKGRPE